MQHTMRAWLFVASLVAGGHLWAAPAPNDSFNNRIALSGTNLTTTASNANASKQNGEPDHAGNPGGASVWWSWTSPTNGDLTIATDGSDFDTLLGVYTGSSVGALSIVASNDDRGVFVTSRVRFQALAGTQYQIAVDGYNDGSGAAVGNVNLALTFVPQPFSRPPNDNFTNRLVLAGVSAGADGSNDLATREAGEPLHAGETGDTSVWWSWTAPANDTVRVTTAGSTFDTLLGIYSGSTLSNLTELASNDDEDPAQGILTSTVILDVVAGQEYQLAVDGYDGAAGQVVLRLDSLTPHLSDPAWLTNGTFQFTLNGAPGTAYGVEASESLTNWTSLGTVTNTAVPVTFTDPAATNYPARFYRAVLR